MQSLTYGLKPIPFKDPNAPAYFNRFLEFDCVDGACVDSGQRHFEQYPGVRLLGDRGVGGATGMVDAGGGDAGAADCAEPAELH